MDEVAQHAHAVGTEQLRWRLGRAALVAALPSAPQRGGRCQNHQLLQNRQLAALALQHRAVQADTQLRQHSGAQRRGRPALRRRRSRRPEQVCDGELQDAPQRQRDTCMRNQRHLGLDECLEEHEGGLASRGGTAPRVSDRLEPCAKRLDHVVKRLRHPPA